MILVIGITDVLLARMVSGRTWLLDFGEQLLLQRQVFQDRLNDIVGVAHCHRRGRRRAARARPLPRRRRDRAGWRRSASSRVSRLALNVSVMVTSWPASANTCAMPCPIRPAPTTAMRAFGHLLIPPCSRHRRRGCGRYRSPTPSRRGTTAGPARSEGSPSRPLGTRARKPLRTVVRALVVLEHPLR